MEDYTVSQYFADIIFYFQPLWCNWPAKLSNSVQKMQNKGYYAVQCQRRSFRVIKDSINRKPVCGFLLVINTNRHPISYHFWVIAAYCSNFGHFAFFSHPLGGFGATYDVHLRLTGTRSGLPIRVNWTLLLDVMGEALRAKTDWKSVICKRVGQYPTNFHMKGTSPTIIFSRIYLKLCNWQFSHKETL